MNSLSNGGFSSLELPVLQPKVKDMNHRKASAHVKEEAARRVVEGGESVAGVAADIDYSPSAVNNWVRAFRKAQDDESEIQEIRKLKEELEQEVASKNEEIRRLELKLEFEEQMRTELMQGILKRR